MRNYEKKKVVGVSLLSLLALAFVAGGSSPEVAKRSVGSKMAYFNYTIDDDLAHNGKYYTDFKSMAETKENSAMVNAEISSEGNTVLKNDGTLPLRKGSKISIFGTAQDNIIGLSATSGLDGLCQTYEDSLERAGFDVNPVLQRWYEKNGSTGSGGMGMGMGGNASYEETAQADGEHLPVHNPQNPGSNPSNFDMSTLQSFDIYNDLGLVVLARTGGEGSDLATTINEEQNYVDEEKKIPVHANETSGYKHYLELTNAESALIEKVKKQFKHVAVVLNTSHVMEMGALEKDDAINAIMWIGRPGENGLEALGKLIAGDINPSGSVVDEWPADFTKDPTWMNFGDNYQHHKQGTNEFLDYDVYYYADGTPTGDRANHGGPGGSDASGSGGFYGVDYEEDIYLGYKYWETRYAEIENAKGVDVANTWYEENVVYPFGFGMSYTTFKMNIEGGKVYTDSKLSKELASTIDGTDFASSEGHVAKVKKLYVPVTVTNTGLVAGKKTVQAYVTAPYKSGETAKSFVVLTGFAKTDTLAPGASQTVVVEMNVQDFASFDYDDKDKDGHKGYELDKGDYTIRIMDSSHFDFATDVKDTEDCYDEFKFTLSNETNLDLDDFSDNKVEVRLSKENGYYDTIREGVNADEDAAGAKFTQLSRADMGTTEDKEISSYPKPSNKAARTFSKEFMDSIYDMECYDADDTYTGTDIATTAGGYQQYDDASKNAETSKTIAGWANDVNIGATWTQATKHEADFSDVKYKIGDIAGIDFDSDEKISQAKNSKFAGKTGKEAWDIFMNQLTWDEITTIIQQANRHTSPVESINLAEGTDEDDPLDLHSTYYWQDEPTVAATWNTDLAKKWGIMVANLGAFCNYTDGWYGPGMDTHRSPFSGRNAQYFSQDGIQGGYIAAAVVGGAESRGMLCFCKHAALNDSETNRANNAHFTWASEQTIRENYYKVFQMAFQEGNASGVMTACARIGRMSAGADYNVCTGLWRKEWGWKGFAITDGYGGIYRPNPSDLMIRTGGDMPLGDSKVESKSTYICYKYTEKWDDSKKNYVADIAATKSARDTSGTWDASLRGGKGGVKVGGQEIEKMTSAGKVNKKGAEIESPAQYYFARTVAVRCLYNLANGMANRNGTTVDFKKGGLKYDTTADLGTVAQGTKLTAESKVSVAVNANYLNGASTEYEVTDGELPDGLSIDSNGNLVGTPSGYAGTYSFTVTCYADNYISGSQTFTITVGSAFKWDGDDVTKAKVGTDFVGYITSDTVKAGTGTGGTTITYALEDGALPDGLDLGADGEISGTPTTAGTFKATIAITAKEPRTSGPSGTSEGSTTTYYYVLNITVADNATEVVDETATKIKALEDKIASLESQLTTLSNKADTSNIEAEIAKLKTELETLKNSSTDKSSSGCGGSIALTSSILASLALAGAGLMLKKKKEDK